METVCIETARLRLRNLRDEDLPALARHRCDATALRYIGEPMSAGEVAVHIARHRDGWSRLDGQALQLTVEVRATAAIGEVMLRDLNTQHRQAEIGIALDPAWHGHGYGVEASIGLLSYAFDDVGLHRIVGYSDVENPAVAIALQTGLRMEGRLRHNRFRDGQWRDEYLLAIIADDWPAVRERHRHLLPPA